MLVVAATIQLRQEPAQQWRQEGSLSHPIRACAPLISGVVNRREAQGSLVVDANLRVAQGHAEECDSQCGNAVTFIYSIKCKFCSIYCDLLRNVSPRGPPACTVAVVRRQLRHLRVDWL
jgi:hypothetical protein